MDRQQVATEPEAMSAQAEFALVRKVLAGQEAAARCLIDAHKDRLFGFIYRMVRNHHEAEDLCQETFLRALASLDKFHGRNRFSTWLFTIGYRLSLNRMRRKKAADLGIDLAELPAGQSDAPHAVANSEEVARLKAAIWREVERLSRPQKAVVLLYYQQAQSCQEIGQVLGMPAATVKSHLHRAREKLRRRLSGTLSEDWVSLDFLGETG